MQEIRRRSVSINRSTKRLQEIPPFHEGAFPLMLSLAFWKPNCDTCRGGCWSSLSTGPAQDQICHWWYKQLNSWASLKLCLCSPNLFTKTLVHAHSNVKPDWDHWFVCFVVLLWHWLLLYPVMLKTNYSGPVITRKPLQANIDISKAAP